MLEQIPKFILFKKNESGDLEEILHPIFEDEIEEYRVNFFQNEPFEILEESIFEEIYNDEYLDQKFSFWTDYAEKLIDSLIGFDIQCVINDEDGSLESEMFALMLNQGDETKLEIWLERSIDPLVSATLVLELSEYFADTFDIDLKGIFYISENKRLYTNEEVHLRTLLEQSKVSKN